MPKDLASRVFDNLAFQIAWVTFLFFLVVFVIWPLRDALLVCWVYGTDAYFRQGIRVLPGKPIRFSNGALSPLLPDLVTGFGTFLASTVGLTQGLSFSMRIYEQRFGKPQSRIQS